MMGHRGCRLAVTYPEIAKMQTSSCYPCSNQCKESSPGLEHKTRNHDPIVGDIKELKYVKKFVVETADAEIAAAGSTLNTKLVQ